MKITKAILWIAAGLILVGGGAIVTSYALGAGSPTTEEVTHTVEETFTSISVTDLDAETIVRRSDNGRTYAVCDETEMITYTLEVKDDTLHLDIQDDRTWIHFIGIRWEHRKVTLYLPAASYDSLTINNSSGAIVCEDEFTFHDATLHTASGSISARINAERKLTATTTSGKIELSDFKRSAVHASTTSGAVILKNGRPKSTNISTVSGAIKLENVHVEYADLKTNSGKIEATDFGNAYIFKTTTTSGAIILKNGQPMSLSTESTSGAVRLENVVVTNELTVKTTSGGITLDRCDGGTIALKSTSGSVRGTLLSDKLFEASSTSGSIDIPPSVKNAGSCKIETTSGSIKINIVA